MFKRLENWDMINVFLNGKSNVCSLFDDFHRNYVNLWNFCSPLIRVKQGEGDKSGSGLKNWYSPELASCKNRMLAYYTVYNNLHRQNPANTEAAHRATLVPHLVKNIFRPF